MVIHSGRTGDLAHRHVGIAHEADLVPAPTHNHRHLEKVASNKDLEEQEKPKTAIALLVQVRFRCFNFNKQRGDSIISSSFEKIFDPTFS